jgi:hypothetical protein
MAWQMRGQLIENCSCNMLCPCWFGVQDLMVMDRGWCDGTIALRIDEGSYDEVDLSGRRAALSVHFPGPTMFDGDGTGRVYVDQGASDEQRKAIETIVQGHGGGPMGQIAPLISNWLATESAPVAFEEDGETITVGVASDRTVRSELLRDPEGNGFTLRGGGFVGGFGLEQAEMAPATGAVWSEPEHPEQNVEYKSGARGAFSWSG